MRRVVITETLRTAPLDPPVQAVAAARGQFDPEQGHAVPVQQAGLGRVIGIARRLDTEMERIRRVEETRRTLPQRRPGAALPVHASDHREGQEREERPMLRVQVIADHPRAEFRQSSQWIRITHWRQMVTGIEVFRMSRFDEG